MIPQQNKKHVKENCFAIILNLEKKLQNEKIKVNVTENSN